MTKFIFPFFSIIIFISSCFAQNKTNHETNSLLWQISGHGLKQPSYIFGTIHVICKDDFLWTESMAKSLNKSDEVCFEMKMDDPNLMIIAAAMMIDTTGKLLKSYFKPEDYIKVRQYFKDSFGTDIEGLQQMKPIILISLMADKVNGCNSPVSYEDSIMKIAQDLHKEILGLETVEEQISVLENIPPETIVSGILLALQSHKSEDSEYNKLLSAYKSQDLPELYNLITQSKDLENNMNAFLDDRNRNWISRMEKKMKNTSVFFAVGAGHLWGDNGVINLLRRKGYKVVSVK